MAKTVTAGSAPSFSASYNPATNNSGSADANGNQLYGPVDPSTGNQVQYSYDVENRTISAYENGGPSTGYFYDPQGKRVLRQTGAPGPIYLTSTANSEFTFYGITGQRLAKFSVFSANYNNSGACSNGANYCMAASSTSWLYFGGRLIGVNGLPVVTDRLGSVRSGISYYPWGEEKTSPPTQDGQVKFGTYFRDMPGQDYADQRYYTATAGRFYTPDPGKGVDVSNPITWNKYAYAGDDPVNFNDRRGLMMDLVDDFGGGGGGFPEWWCSPGDPTCFTDSGGGACVGNSALQRPGCAADPWGDYGPPPVVPPAPPSPNVTLREVDDCIYPQGTGLLPGVWTLEVEYQILVNNQPVFGNLALNALGIVIKENVTKTSPNSNIDSTGGMWCPVGGNCDTAGSINSSEDFWDALGGTGTADQTFLFNGQQVPVSFAGVPGSQPVPAQQL